MRLNRREFTFLAFGLLLSAPLASLRLPTAGAGAGDVPAAPAGANPDLALHAKAILQQYCYRCHAVVQKVADFNMLDSGSLTRARGEAEDRFAYVVPGKPDESLIWKRAGGADPEMPPSGPKPSAQEREVLRQWIAAGAPFPERTRRPFLADATVLGAMRDYLLHTPADDRQFKRFFTLTHLYNNYERVTESDLRLYRAALSKVINSVSNAKEIVIPEPVPGTEETVYVVEINRLGWDPHVEWAAILRQYPYGLLQDESTDAQIKQIAKDTRLFAGTALSYIRADWFVVFASQPPLYNVLLHLPATARDLEESMGVDAQRNIRAGRYPEFARAGFSESGVSKQNRLVERHTSRDGYYWRSYDFKPRAARNDLLRFPLGPQAAGNPFSQLAFKQAGGEIIWSLPNGLQAYMLVRADDSRLDDPAPADIVSDDKSTAGTPAIVNGISCMACHREGMLKGFHDEIRGAGSTRGNALEEVLRQYPPASDLSKLLDGDARRFTDALERTIGPFLKVAEDSRRKLSDFPEPVSRVAQLYLADLDAREVALELGLESPREFTDRLSRELLRFGLGTLAQVPPGKIKREKWESLSGTSLFQDVAVELQRGVPLVPG